MKNKILIILILIMPCGTTIQAQKIFTLKECYDLAYTANALAGEKEAYNSISELKAENISKGWLPTLDAGGSLVYNSDVVDMSGAFANIPLPGFADAIKPLPHEQYRITLDINQVIYDGGAIKGAKALEKAEKSINEKQTETDLYKLRSQINTYFFNILLLERQRELLENYQDLISRKMLSLQSAIDNGVIMKSDLDVLSSEKIKLEQQQTENKIKKSALQKILSTLTGVVIDDSTELILPNQSDELTDEILRPELQLFDLRGDQLTAGLKILESKRLPKAFGFATLGYGNPPGNNFFKDEFAPYYVVGAGVKWNIFDWNKTKNEKKMITLQKGIIENRKTDISDNLARLLESKKAEIMTLQSLIKSDNELISIRKRVTASAESQYTNGTITATAYLDEINSEKQAVINNDIHIINLELAKIEYINISGKEVE